MKQVSKLFKEFLTSSERVDRLWGLSMLKEYILLAERFYGINPDEELGNSIIELTKVLEKYEENK